MTVIFEKRTEVSISFFFLFRHLNFEVLDQKSAGKHYNKYSTDKHEVRYALEKNCHSAMLKLSLSNSFIFYIFFVELDDPSQEFCVCMYILEYPLRGGPSLYHYSTLSPLHNKFCESEKNLTENGLILALLAIVAMEAGANARAVVAEASA